jgi:hypothetical protein
MPQFLTDIQFIATSSIETPATGFATMYMNTDGYLYIKLPNGEQVRLHSL